MKKDHIVTPWGLTQSPVGVKQGAIWIIDLVSKNVCKRRLISSVELLRDILIGRTSYHWGFQISFKEDDFVKEVKLFFQFHLHSVRQTYYWP